ncbi:hypothetical protein ACIBF1_35175 [Spirillospora sp. NPDC050679]
MSVFNNSFAEGVLLSGVRSLRSRDAGRQEQRMVEVIGRIRRAEVIGRWVAGGGVMMER